MQIIDGKKTSQEIKDELKEEISKSDEVLIEVRNKIFKGDTLEVISAGRKSFAIKVDYIINSEGEEVDAAPHPKEKVIIPASKAVKKGDLLRRAKD